MSGPIIDTVTTYQFIKRLATPFDKWKAYKLGIIDKDGRVLRPRNELKTPAEKDAWGRFDILVANLKKIMNKVPGLSSRLGSIAAAMFLMKEGLDQPEDDLDFLEEKVIQYSVLVEDMGAGAVAGNNAGGGQIAGIGVGPSGEPGMSPRKTKYQRGNASDEGKQTATVKKIMKQLQR
jgi:hypothetical protein